MHRKRHKRSHGEGTVYQRKDGFWVCQLSTDQLNPKTGKKRRLTYSARSRKEVLAWKTRTQGALATGRYTHPDKLTLAQWLPTWLQEYKARHVRPRTLYEYTLVIRKHLIPQLGQYRLTDLRPHHVHQFVTALPVSPLRIRFILSILHGAMQQAMINEDVHRNVVSLATRPKHEARPHLVLSMQQFEHAFIPANRHERLLPAAMLAFCAGLRRGEILGLTREHINLTERWLDIRQILNRVPQPRPGKPQGSLLQLQPPKTAASVRRIPLPQIAVDILRPHITQVLRERLQWGKAYEDHGLIFCHENGRMIDPRTLGVHFDRMMRQAGLPDLRLHDARHTYATWLRELGVDIKVVQAYLGHTQASITLDIYSHVTPRLSQEGADRLNSAFGRA